MSKHFHTVEPTGSKGTGWQDAQWGVSPVTIPIELVEVTCTFDGDPTSDDAAIKGQLWLEEGQETFKCPVCGDEITPVVSGG